ncbi:MAG: PEP-CTERM sorting domain-containing protein [Kiritimatiellales bacterium]
MKKLSILLLLVGTSCCGLADIVTNLIADGGFEGLDAATFEPSTNSSPWFTDELTKWPLQTETDPAMVHSGNQALVWQYYANDPVAIQTLGVQVAAGKKYEVDLWCMLAEGSATFTSNTVINVSVWTSPTIDGTYKYIAGVFGLQPTAIDEYQNFSHVYTVNDLSARVGEYMQLRIVKANINTEYRIFVDDVSFGEVIPEPATMGLLGLGICLAFWFHGRRLRAQA